MSPWRSGSSPRKKIARVVAKRASAFCSSTSASARNWSTGKPCLASAIAGAASCRSGLVPKRCKARCSPAGLPGTPADEAPKRTLSSSRVPSARRYMPAVADCGAHSRKSNDVVVPSAMRTSKKPPPPRLPACGCVTASVSATATAASTALPPSRSTARPAAVACGSQLTTTPALPRATMSLGSLAAAHSSSLDRANCDGSANKHSAVPSENRASSAMRQTREDATQMRAPIIAPCRRALRRT